MTTCFTERIQASWREHLIDHELSIRKVTTADADYAKILDIRGEAYSLPEARIPCPVDAYSSLWLLESPSVSLGSVRLTAATRGIMDCEAHFPSFFRSDFAEVTASGSRLCVRPEVSPKLLCAKILMDYSTADILDNGICCDVIDVRESAVPYYQRLGCKLLREHRFTHPLFKTRSRVMVAVAHPRFTSRSGLLWSAKPECEITARLMERLNAYLE